MAWRLVTSTTDSLRTFQELEANFASGAMPFPQHDVGWPGGHARLDIFWHPTEAVWGTFQRTPPGATNRKTPCFWICFGTQSPEKVASLDIAVETNPPHQGVDARLGGAFAIDDAGHVYLLHSGRVGGGKRGVSPARFLETCTDLNTAFVPERNSTMIVISRISAPDLTGAIGRYVHRVAEFKEAIRSGV